MQYFSAFSFFFNLLCLWSTIPRLQGWILSFFWFLPQVSSSGLCKLPMEWVCAEFLFVFPLMVKAEWSSNPVCWWFGFYFCFVCCWDEATREAQSTAKWKSKSLSPVWHFATPWTSSQGHISGVGSFFPSPGLHWWLRGKISACNVGDLGSIPESARSPGEGNGNPLQYTCLRNSMDGGAW